MSGGGRARGLRIRPRARSLAVVAAAFAFLAGCTFLIDFQDVPDAGDAEAGASQPPPPPGNPGDAGDGASDADADAPRDASRALDLDALKSCRNVANGYYCGDDGIVGYPYPNDLVACDGGKVAQATPCSYGLGCLHLPTGYADECDDCHAKPNGFYCGGDLKGWVDGTNVLVHCLDGSTDTFVNCGAPATAGPTCASDGGGGAKCQ